MIEFHPGKVEYGGGGNERQGECMRKDMGLLDLEPERVIYFWMCGGT